MEGRLGLLLFVKADPLFSLFRLLSSGLLDFGLFSIAPLKGQETF